MSLDCCWIMGTFDGAYVCRSLVEADDHYAGRCQTGYGGVGNEAGEDAFFSGLTTTSIIACTKSCFWRDQTPEYVQAISSFCISSAAIRPNSD